MIKPILLHKLWKDQGVSLSGLTRDLSSSILSSLWPGLSMQTEGSPYIDTFFYRWLDC